MSENEKVPDTSTTGVIRDSLQSTSIAIVTLCVLAVVTATYVLKPVLIPIVLALLVAGALDPVVARFDRARIPRPLTAAIFVGGFLAALLLAVWSFSTPVSQWVRSVPDQISRAELAFRELRQPVEKLTEEVDELGEKITQDRDYQPKVTLEEDTLSEMVMSSAMRTFGYFFLTIVLLYFVIGFGHHISLKLRAALGHDLIGDIATSISSYLFKVTVINAGLGLAIGLAMWVLGMPNPPLWGVLAFAMNFLPYVGGVIGIGLVAFVSTLTFETVAWQLIPPCTYLVLTSIEANFVTPTLLGIGFPLNPLVLFVWVLLSGWIWGFIGALFAVPLLMAIRLTCAQFPRMQFIGDLIGEMPPGQRWQGSAEDRINTKQSDGGSGSGLPG